MQEAFIACVFFVFIKQANACGLPAYSAQFEAICLNFCEIFKILYLCSDINSNLKLLHFFNLISGLFPGFKGTVCNCTIPDHVEAVFLKTLYASTLCIKCTIILTRSFSLLTPQAVFPLDLQPLWDEVEGTFGG